MTFVIALSRSASFNRHLSRTLAGNQLQLLESWGDYASLKIRDPHVLLIHFSLLSEMNKQDIQGLSDQKSIAIGIASDLPSLDEALTWLPTGISAYFNSYMVDTHYQHMLQAVQMGQNWIAPQILQGLVALAQNGMTGATASNQETSAGLEMLTPRELEIAEAVSSGMKNKMIAERFGVTERTVKAHLSHIFEKLQITNRLELSVMMHNRQAS